MSLQAFVDNQSRSQLAVGIDKFLADLPSAEKEAVRSLPETLTELQSFNQRIILELVKLDHFNSGDQSDANCEKKQALHKLRSEVGILEGNLRSEKLNIEILLAKFEQQIQNRKEIEKQTEIELLRTRKLEDELISLRKSKTVAMGNTKKPRVKLSFGSRLDRFGKAL